MSGYSNSRLLITQLAGLSISLAVPAISRLFFDVGDLNLLAIYALLMSTLSNSYLFSKDRRTLKINGKRMIDGFTVIPYALGASLLFIKNNDYFSIPNEKYGDEPYIVNSIIVLCAVFLLLDSHWGRQPKSKTPKVDNHEKDKNDEMQDEVVIVRLKKPIPLEKK